VAATAIASITIHRHPEAECIEPDEANE